MDPAILAVFGPVPDGIDVEENKAPENDAAAVAMAVLAAIALVLRLLAKFVQRTGLKIDDWIIIVAFIFVVGTVALSVAGGVAGAGKHVWAVTLDDLTLIFKILYSYTFVYAAACAATKISLLFFYRRIFLGNDPTFKASLAFGFFLSVSYPIIIWVTMANCCKPISFYWNQFSGAEGTCIDTKQFYLALGIINMINDVIILSIPIPQILKLQMSARKKAGVIGILLLGGFVCVASVLRIYYLKVFIDAVDITWVMGPVFIWSAIEPSMGIVSACLPHLGPLRRLVRNKIASTWGSNAKSGSRSNSTPWRSGGGGGANSQASGGLVTIGGGLRYSFRGDRKMLKLSESDDEIGLTNRITGGGGDGGGPGPVVGKVHSSESGSDLEDVKRYRCPVDLCAGYRVEADLTT